MKSQHDERVMLDRKIAAVLRRDSCSGCGFCALLDTGLAMTEDESGYLRPRRVSDGITAAGAGKTFSQACPGVRVSAKRDPASPRHPLFGSYLSVWRAWAGHPDIRTIASSGGALTALNVWLLETKRATQIIGAASAPDPRRSVAVTITTRAEAVSAAGSRYSPVSVLSDPGVLAAGSVVVCKPCEASALSALQPRSEEPSPLILSFFCAGTPSARATDTLLAELGVGPETPLDELWYRGHGWPGEFTARAGSNIVRAGYDESWGRSLGPTTQWRCKVCPDGVGESADIVAADYWEVDEQGYPSFLEGAGVSALIARTQRGLAVILEAEAAGVIHIEPISMDSLASAQPLQRDRRRFLAARLIGSRLAGRSVPTYRGFGLLRLSLSDPRRALVALRGTFGRVRRSVSGTR
jgi:coenzyme F420 hydrogenase subunit beta